MRTILPPSDGRSINRSFSESLASSSFTCSQRSGAEICISMECNELSSLNTTENTTETSYGTGTSSYTLKSIEQMRKEVENIVEKSFYTSEEAAVNLSAPFTYAAFVI